MTSESSQNLKSPTSQRIARELCKRFRKTGNVSRGVRLEETDQKAVRGLQSDSVRGQPKSGPPIYLRNSQGETHIDLKAINIQRMKDPAFRASALEEARRQKAMVWSLAWSMPNADNVGAVGYGFYGEIIFDTRRKKGEKTTLSL